MPKRSSKPPNIIPRIVVVIAAEPVVRLQAVAGAGTLYGVGKLIDGHCEITHYYTSLWNAEKHRDAEVGFFGPLPGSPMDKHAEEK